MYCLMYVYLCIESQNVFKLEILQNFVKLNWTERTLIRLYTYIYVCLYVRTYITAYVYRTCINTLNTYIAPATGLYLSMCHIARSSS